MRVDPVRSRADLRAFCELPVGLHPTEHYVPLLEDTVRAWHRGEGPHTDHGEVELLLARDASGEVVGRTTVHSDDRMDARLGTAATLLGATEFAGPEALGALVEAASERARRDSRSVLLGPVSLLPNQTGGVITSGHDERGFVDSPWNPDWYPAAWEDCGFQPLWPGATWICEGLQKRDVRDDLGEPEPLPPGVELHHGSRRHLADQLPVLRQMLNASFAELPYYTPISAAELETATDGLSHLLDESLLMYLTDAGKPVAFVLVVPDISRFVQHTGGRLPWYQQLRLLAARSHYRREAVLIIKGTVPEARGRGLMRALHRELLVNLQAGGYETLRVTQVGQENEASAAPFRAMGGRPLHDVTFYRKELL
ncbi:GNAT family N-acetyltransferase [Kytococcus sedentarius]|uniref:GNAT family N-acetyltransferase n=1 Tax=Kytococcus sedentarius TaxID=1276 RepID=UPI0035BC078A